MPHLFLTFVVENEDSSIKNKKNGDATTAILDNEKLNDSTLLFGQNKGDGVIILSPQCSGSMHMSNIDVDAFNRIQEVRDTLQMLLSQSN